MEPNSEFPNTPFQILLCWVFFVSWVSFLVLCALIRHYADPEKLRTRRDIKELMTGQQFLLPKEVLTPLGVTLSYWRNALFGVSVALMAVLIYITQIKPYL